MALYKRRDKFSRSSEWIGRVFGKFGLSPNQWTLLSLIPALGCAYFLINSQFLYAAVLLFISAFLDVIDGSVARVKGKTTKLGAYLDTMIDRYVEAIVIFGLMFSELPWFFISPYAWLIFYLFGGMMTTYAKAAAKEKGMVKNEMSGGLLERAERIGILTVGIFLAVYNRIYLSVIIAFLAIFTNLSAVQRIAIVVSSPKKLRK